MQAPLNLKTTSEERRGARTRVTPALGLVPRLRVPSKCMERMDRARWSTGFTFCSHGVRFGVRSTDGELLERLVPHLPPRWTPCADERVDFLYSLSGGVDGHRYHSIYVGIVRLGRSLEFREMAETFAGDLQIRVAEFARGRVFVHAGVVGWDGGAIVIPGKSRSGKSTLVDALVRAGATYYSDEYAVFDMKGRIHPYARPISLRQADGGFRPVTMDEIGGREGRTSLPLDRVILTEYRAGAGWRPRACSHGRAVMALFAHTIPARRKPAAALAALRLGIANATVLRGSRGEAAEFAAHLLKRSSMKTTVPHGE